MKSHIIALLLLCSLTPLSHAALVEQQIDYRENNTILKGFVVYDDSLQGKRPGVLVVHEWWGHNEYTRERARMLAKLGYVALAVDMYGDGRQASHPDEAQKFSREIATNMALGKARFLAAMAQLKKHRATDAEKIAAIGYCFGGAVVIQMAREEVDLDGVVSFHGSLSTSNPAKPGAIKASILVAHGGADPFIPGDQLLGFIEEMNQAGADYQLEIYGGAKHSFTNPDADKFGARFNLPLRYDPQADKASWEEMQRFFNRIFE